MSEKEAQEAMLVHALRNVISGAVSMGLTQEESLVACIKVVLADILTRNGK